MYRWRLTIRLKAPIMPIRSLTASSTTWLFLSYAWFTTSRNWCDSGLPIRKQRPVYRAKQWYSAHQPRSITSIVRGTLSDLTVCIPDNNVRVLGCSAQYQFCNPNLESNTSCTPLAGIFAALGQAEQLWKTESQKALFDWVVKSILRSAIGLPNVVLLGVSSLTSRYKLLSGVQGSLPDN